jgi:hypothetical protein
MSKAKRLSPGVVKMLSDVAGKKTPTNSQSSPKLRPTPEQMRRGSFRQTPVKTDQGQVTSSAFRRQPLFETLAKGNSGIDAEGLRALRFYREAHEATARSLTRCALDAEGRGGGGVPLGLPPSMLADYRLKTCEDAIADLLPTMRAVVLEDQSFSAIAIERFGGRKQNWLVQEESRGRIKKGGKMKFIDKIVPRSGRHRELIKEEFARGVKRLTKAVAPYLRTGG